MSSLNIKQKCKEIGKTFTEVSTELSQWPSWIKESLKSAWREYELTWFQCKRVYIEHGKGKNERRTRQNTRIQVIQEQTDEFINQLNEAESSLSDLDSHVFKLRSTEKSI